MDEIKEQEVLSNVPSTPPIYVNDILVASTFNDLSLICSSKALLPTYSEESIGKQIIKYNTANIVLSPQTAKQLFKALEKALKDYENQFGEIVMTKENATTI